MLKKNRKDVKENLDQFVAELAALSHVEINATRQKLKPPPYYSF
jgi:hypothetical protein